MIANTSERADALPTSSLAWLSETWRLARWQLFLVRRRLMSKILLILLLVFYAIVVGFVALIYTVASSSNADDIGTITIRNLIAFPTSLSLAGIYTRIVGVLLLCVLVGALIGSEYGFGTLRLILPRGTGRGQLLVAQIGAVAMLSLATAGFMLLVAMLVGLILGPIFGATLLFPSLATWAEIIKFWLALSFHLFGYALIAYFAGTLGRSVLAGVAMPLGYLFLEVFVGNIVINIVALLLSRANVHDAAERVRHIPDWFLGSNTSAIMTLVGQYPLNLDLGSTSFSLVRALAVALLYCVLLIGGSYLLLTSRDVTD
jgi:ABC-2 type transport system permease protein